MKDLIDVRATIDKVLKDVGLSASQKQIKTVEDIFNSTMNNQQKQYSNYTEQRALVEGIIQQYIQQGASKEDTLLLFADINHMELYNNFMGRTETKRMVDKLLKAGLPLDILRGVKIDTNGDKLTPEGYPNVRVEFLFGKNDEQSIYLEFLKIYEIDDDGKIKIIFEFEMENDYEEDEEPEEREISKKRKGAKSGYEGSIQSITLGTVKQWTDKNGKTFYTDRFGHRVKVEKGRVLERTLFGWE